MTKELKKPLPPGRTTSYPCINHDPERDAWVQVGDILYCRHCYLSIRRPELKIEN
jgi:hypothetical protein